MICGGRILKYGGKGVREELTSLDRLLLDPNNYRFHDADGFVQASESRFGEESVQQRAYERIRTSGINELKSSILANGFLPFERVVVRPYRRDGEETGLYVVVEGNRRIAALRWIQQDHEAGVEVRPDVVAVLDELPVIVVEDGQGGESDSGLLLSLMGVRHVGGIREWGGYQRAKLVTELRDVHGFDTAEIAARLGMTAHEANRRYRAFRALQQMMRDEEWGDQASPDMYSLFHEAVIGTAIKEWLGWDEEAASFQNPDELATFYSLITPTEDDEGNIEAPKLPTREAVRELRDILPVPEARRTLFELGGSFHEALALAKADSLSRTWLSQVAEAIAALRSIGALELQGLGTGDIAEIERLRAVASDLLELHSRVTGASEGDGSGA